ncbi:MAG: TPR repeat protein [Candidatus Azotimanducaceae bacterium]|jgi:TPR repeat protein
MKWIFLFCLIFPMPVLADKFSDTKALAEQGDAAAQSNLGMMYRTGKGTAQDFKLAVKWSRLSADQGYADAQWSLGNMYEEGQGLLQDYKMAHMWYNIAAANGDEDSAENRSRITKEMSPEALNQAQDMARKWVAAH